MIFHMIDYKPSSNAPLRCVSTMSVRSCLYICQKKDKKGSVKISVQLKYKCAKFKAVACDQTYKIKVVHLKFLH